MIHEVNLKDFSSDFDEFIFDKNQQTIFSSKLFLSYHYEKFNTKVIIFTEKNNVVAFLPLSENFNSIISHPGSTYGGVVQLKKISEKALEVLISQFLDFLKKKKIKTYEFRLPPKIFTLDSFDQINQSILKKCSLYFPEEESYVSLKTKNFETLNTSNFAKGHKSEIKLFMNNNENYFIKTLNDTQEINQFYKILEKNLNKFNKKPTHKVDELLYLIEKLPENVLIKSLIKDEKILASVVNFILNDSTVHTFYSSFNYDAIGNKGALKYLYWELLKEYSRIGFEYFNFGIDQHYGEEENKSLRYFKNGFGSEQVERVKYVLQIN